MFNRAQAFLFLAITILIVSCSAVERSSPLPTLSVAFEPDYRPSKKIIIFVHGLFGDPVLSWTNRAGISWQQLIRQDQAFERFSVARVRYNTPLLTRTSTIEEIATRVLRRLQDEGVFNHDEIYFVSHSMGGIITKRMLVALNRQSQKEKLSRVKAALFISTPAQGSNIAEIGGWLSSNPQLRDIRPADMNSFLQALENDWGDLFRERRPSRFPLSFCAYETKSTYGAVIVPRTLAATYCDQNPIAIDENHSDIVKPVNADADIYKWARARILETSNLAERRSLQYSLGKTPYNYKRGVIVEGIEWQETYGEYEFSVRNPNNDENISDVRLTLELPWALVKWQTISQQGCDGLALSQDRDNSFKVGNEHAIREVIPFRTNILNIDISRMRANALCRVNLILKTDSFRASDSAIASAYRYESDASAMSYYQKILVHDDGIAVSIDSEILKGERKVSVIMEPERPIEFPPSKNRPLTVEIPVSAIGTIHDLANPIKPLGAGFVLDDPHFVVTASSVVFDSGGNLRWLVYVTTDDTGLPVILPIEAYQPIPFTEIAIMKIPAEKIPQGILTRGNSEKLDSGDLVAYVELVLGEENKRVFRPNANRIERITRQNGVRTFVIRGPLKSEVVGGPLLGGGNTAVGIVTKVNLEADNRSTFYALDIQAIPKLPK